MHRFGIVAEGWAKLDVRHRARLPFGTQAYLSGHLAEVQ
jgi:hypothetical protein